MLHACLCHHCPLRFEPVPAHAQDCNLILYGGGPTDTTALFATNTYHRGEQPCRLMVSGAGGGGFAVLDATERVVFSAGAYSPEGTPEGTLPAGQTLSQVQTYCSCLVVAQLKAV